MEGAYLTESLQRLIVSWSPENNPRLRVVELFEKNVTKFIYVHLLTSCIFFVSNNYYS